MSLDARLTISKTGLLTACAILSGLAGCGNQREIDVGQVRGADAAGGSLNLGGSNSAGGGVGNGSDTGPCGPAPCADFTGDKTFVEQGTPDSASGLFDGAAAHDPGTTAASEPVIIYPSHETMLPLNVSHIRHDWATGKNDLFELRFVGPKTTVSVYSLRATGFVSMPISWDELRKPRALVFTPADALARVRKHGDLFAPVLTLKQHLPTL